MSAIRKLAFAALAGLAIIPSQAPAQGTSPHNFYAPQCTWSADWNAWWSGWNLQFSRNWGRDAYLWWDLVRGVGRGFWPAFNSIMVIHNSANGGVGGSAGHVVWVRGAWFWSGQYWILGRHSNWPNGSGMRDDWFIWRHTDGKVRRDGESTWRTTRGFLYHP